MQMPWESVAYPDFCELNASMGFSLGLSLYHINAIPLQTEHLYDVSIGAYTMGLTQVLGYSHWFYLQLREQVSLGGTYYGGKTSIGQYPDRCSFSWFFDGDARLYVPFRVSPQNRLSVQPFIGFAMHQAYLKGGISTDSGANRKGKTLLRQRLFAPMAGLALGYNPSDAFALRASLSYHMPSGKHVLPVQESPEASNYTHLGISRHGIGANFLALAKLTPDWTLRGEVDYFYYSVYAHRTGSTLWETNATSRLSIKCGASYQF